MYDKAFYRKQIENLDKAFRLGYVYGQNENSLVEEQARQQLIKEHEDMVNPK